MNQVQTPLRSQKKRKRKEPAPAVVPISPLPFDSNEQLKMLTFLRDRDFGGSLEKIATFIRLERLFTQIISSIWALVFSYLKDWHRIAILPFVSKKFEKLCRDPESWCATDVAENTLSYRMFFRLGEASIRLKKIAHLHISDRFLYNLTGFGSRSSLEQMDKIFLVPKAISIEVKNLATPSVVRFVRRNASHLQKLYFWSTQASVAIPDVFFSVSVPFESLRSLQIGVCKLGDFDLKIISCSCPSLVGFHFNGPSGWFTRKGFDALLKCKKLKTLTIEANYEFCFSQLLTQLKKLTLTNWRDLHFPRVPTHQPWPSHQLNKLCLKEISKNSIFADQNLVNPSIFDVFQLPQTKQLIIHQSSFISEEELFVLLKRTSNLESLMLFPGCPQLKNGSSFSILNKMITENLSNLSFGYTSLRELRSLIVQVRESLVVLHFLKVTGDTQNIKFSFTKQEMNENICGVIFGEEWRALKQKLLPTWKLFPLHGYFIPGVLKISKSAWLAAENDCKLASLGFVQKRAGLS